MAAHEANGKSDEWYTPSAVFEALGLEFTMDVASPGFRHVGWISAETHITKESDGLAHQWKGSVWMNPAFGKRNGYLPWAEKFVQHGRGVALAPNRTACPWFQWFASRVDGLLFWAPKIKFIRPDGSVGGSPGYGSVLLSMGETETAALKALHGKHGLFATPSTGGPET